MSSTCFWMEGYLGRLVTRISDNLELQLRDLHIRFQDCACKLEIAVSLIRISLKCLNCGCVSCVSNAQPGPPPASIAVTSLKVLFCCCWCFFFLNFCVLNLTLNYISYIKFYRQDDCDRMTLLLLAVHRFRVVCTWRPWRSRAQAAQRASESIGEPGDCFVCFVCFFRITHHVSSRFWSLILVTSQCTFSLESLEKMHLQKLHV